MQNKVKKFSHKLLALFMAIVMLLTCFSGALSAFAANSNQTKYVDGDVEYNTLAWNVLSDEQLATAILDFADANLPILKEFESTIHDMVDGMSVSVLKINHSMSNRQITVKALGINLATVTLKLGSVDELLETINSVQSVLSGGLMNTAQDLGIDLGAVFSLDLSAVGGKQTNGNKEFPKMRRDNTSSCDIVRGVLGLIYDNNDTLFGRILRGEFSLGLVDGAFNVYDLIGNFVGLSADQVKANPVYNIAQSMLFNYTEWFTADEIAAYQNGTKDFKFDDVLLDKMAVELLSKISAPITYDEGEKVSSQSRYAEIKAVMDETGKPYAEVAASLGYDPNLVYSDEFVTSAGVYQNILLFAYGSPDEKGLATKDTQVVRLEKTDSLFDFGYKALDFAWKTALKDTVKLIHVNNDVDRGHGSNFDNEFFYWMNSQGRWNKTDVASNYDMANVNEWAKAVCTNYGTNDPAEFLGWVKHNYEFDRTKVEDAQGNWRDIDATTLFNKVRYSPLADYAFDMQTGPINLYFMQMGTPNLDEFFAEDYAGYSSMVAGFNDCLAAAVADLFPTRDNIYVNDKGDTTRPTMQTTGDIPTINATSVSAIATTLVNNALLMIQYVADTTDQNILGGFTGGTLSEENLETAMLPMLIACIGQIWLNGNGKLCDIIHDEDWDACADAEGVAYLVLKEYLSYVIPNKDYSVLASTDSEGKIQATLEGTILPMARDAIIYVIEPYVPVTTKDGKPFKAEEGSTVDTTTDVFDLFNSVVCYYADSYSFKLANRQGEKALAAGPLFGLCDTNANSTVNRSKDLWENLDEIANNLLPMLGQLQGNGRNNFDSKSLIMGDIVSGILEIGEKHSGTNMYGVSNFIYRLLTFISAAPIQTDRLIDTVYDVIADIFNALFGDRYDGQDQTAIIPARNSENPFDALVQKNVIAGTGPSDLGVFQRFIRNFIEFAGYGTNGVKTYKDSILPGLTFAVSAVNSFFGFLPFIDNHNLKMATASIEQAVFQGCTNDGSYTTTATIANNATGINSAYLSGTTGNVEQMSRYYIKVNSVDVNGTTTDTNVTGVDKDRLIAPGEKADVSVTTKFQADDNNSSSYAITFNYDICLADGTEVDGGLKTTTYQYLTGARSWRETVYDRWHDWEESRPYTGYYLKEKVYESDKADASMSADGYTAYTTPYFGNTKNSGQRLTVGYPGEIVLSSSNPELVNDLGVRIRNLYGIGTGKCTVDGIYYYDTEPIINDATGSEFTPNQNNAVPVFDKATGAILNLEKVDVSLDAGQSWPYTGLTPDEADSKLAEIQKNGTDITNATTRTHIVYTFDQLKASSALAAYHQNEIGQFENIYLKSGSGEFNYDQLLKRISVRGPIDGFYFNPVQYSIPGNTSLYFHFLNYDGKTEVPYTDITANACFYNSTKSATAQLHFVICDDNNAASVNDKIESVQAFIANYKDDDFNNGEKTYEFIQNAITKGLASTALPITPDTAAKLSDVTEFTYVTADTTSATGDDAYTPLTTADYNELSDEVKAMLYFNNGKYYFNADHTQPVYSTTRLTSADTKDSMGIPVEPVTDDNNVVTYKVSNSPKMATQWKTDGVYKEYPCQISTGSQAVDGADRPVYEQIQWSYYNAAGRKVSSTSTWVIKVPDMSNQLITPTETQDTRGIYTQCRDLLDYTVSEVINKDLKAGIAASLLTNVSEVRQDLNEKNFDIVTYNAMVSMAKDIESKYSVNVSYVENGETVERSLSYVDYAKLVKSGVNISKDDIEVVSSLSSSQVKEYQRLFNIFMQNVVERGYLGDQLEAEILCASGNTWNRMTATPAEYDEETGKLLTPANVAKTANAADPRFGQWDANGNLVNDGKWSDASWNVYVERLADAVNIATIGNDSSYPKNNAIYDPTVDYAASVTRVYDADTLLQMAELALTPLESVQVTVADVPGATVTINGEAVTGSVSYEVGTSITVEVTAADGYIYQHMLVNDNKEFRNPYTIDLKSGMDTITIVPVVEADKPAGYNVSASLVVAKNARGATDNKGVNGDYTVTIKDGDTVIATETFALTKDAYTFSFADIPSGTYTMEISSKYAFTRSNITLVVNDADVVGGAIPMIACNFMVDEHITVADAGYVYQNKLGAVCDLNGDGRVTVADAGIVYSCTGGKVLPDVTIS